MRARPGFVAPIAITLVAAIAVAMNRSGADIAIAQSFFDAATQAFRWRDHPLLVVVLHDGAKHLATVLAVGVLVACSIAWTKPSGRLAAWRPALTYLAAASLASAAIVALIKQSSGHSCPWDLGLFGGRYDWYPLFDPRPAHPGPGRCLPSGHASTGFMWIAALYALRRAPPHWRTRRVAASLGGAVSTFALTTSVAQVLRGAHFVSHVMLTGAVCWAIAWTLDRVMPTGREPRDLQEARTDAGAAPG